MKARSGILLCALLALPRVFSAEEPGAETVPLPDDPLPVVPVAPVKPEPIKSDARNDKKKNDKNEKKNAAAQPKAESVPLPPEPVAGTPREKDGEKVTDTPPPVVPPKDPVVQPLPAIPQPMPVSRGAPVVGEDLPAGESILLPAEKPVLKPEESAAVIQPEVSDAELSKIALVLDSATVAPGENAVFNLFGPETFLRGATARLLLKDAWGREVFRGKLAVQELPFTEGKPRQLKLAVAQPLIEAHTLDLVLIGVGGREVKLSAPFSVAKRAEWNGWLSLTAMPPDAAGWATLKDIGIRGGMQYRLHAGRREALKKANAPFFVENVSRHLFSRYHVEPGLWDKTLARMSADPTNRTHFFRDPSLCSNRFAEALAKEIQLHGEAYAKDSPLFYSLAAEPSMTRLAAAADFDLSPVTVEEFQRWLERDVYGTVAALNASWGTQFKNWSDVAPMTTDEARLRMADGVMNAAPWVDFREFQDHWFSKTLRDGGTFLRRFDPNAKIGITGAMGAFAFGGWDWSRLSQSLDVVEAYDIGHARELWRDLAPGKPALAVLPLMETTDGPPNSSEAIRALWRFALEGGPRAVLLWDDAGEGVARRTLLNSGSQQSDFARVLAPHLKALENDAGMLLSRCERAHDGVAILYSPASVRVNWLLEASRLHPNDWLRAWGSDSSGERRESPQLRLRESWIKLLEDLGFGWRFVSSRDVEQNALLNPANGIRTLILPRAVALSDEEAAAINAFAAKGGRVIADATCGRFDKHGRLRAKPALDELLQVDTSREPFAPEAPNPLEEIRLPAAERAGVQLPPYLTRENMQRLAPVFSDGPRWTGPWRVPEYRRSPVLAIGKARSAFLNLDLTDYLRWRLHPDEPRAQAVRDVLSGLLFSEVQAESAIDWSASQIPFGTQIVWLKARGNSSGRVLALRRNPQNRLHELGAERDSNALFEKPEPFKIVLRKAARSLAIFPAGEVKKEGTVLEGVLDPAAPVVFALDSEAAPIRKLSIPQKIRAGETLRASIEDGADVKSMLLHVSLVDPAGNVHPEYSQFLAKDGNRVDFTIPLALNDVPGAWKMVIRDLPHASEVKQVLEIEE